MNRDNNIKEELVFLGSQLADIPKNMPFVVPEGYFEQLPGLIAAKEELLAISGPVAVITKNMPFVVPEAYFDQLPGAIAAKVSSASLLNSKKYGAPYAAPVGYFDQLPGEVLLKAKGNRKQEIRKRFISFRGTKWAVAATLAVIVSIGGYMMYSENRLNQAENILAIIPGSEISEYVQHNGLDVGAQKGNIDIANLNVDKKDIVTYLNETGWE